MFGTGTVVFHFERSSQVLQEWLNEQVAKYMLGFLSKRIAESSLQQRPMHPQKNGCIELYNNRIHWQKT
jgi:hypothetical protein